MEEEKEVELNQKGPGKVEEQGEVARVLEKQTVGAVAAANEACGDGEKDEDTVVVALGVHRGTGEKDVEAKKVHGQKEDTVDAVDGTQIAVAAAAAERLLLAAVGQTP